MLSMGWIWGTKQGRKGLCAAVISAMLVNNAVAQAVTLQIPANLAAHDPSRLIEDNGNFYFYVTGADLVGWYTTNEGSTWNVLPALLPNGIPKAVHALVPDNDGHDVWAPDVIYNPNSKLFHIYYGVSVWHNSTQSAIGLITSPTLDPAKAVWTDQGPVIYQADLSSKYQAVDPGPFFDFDGNFWITLGSGLAVTSDTSLNVIALDKVTGLRSDKLIHNIYSGHYEASIIQPHNGYYYLFWNSGGCCYGINSTYTIHVARSATVTGTYSGERVYLTSTNTEHGPGHIGFLGLGSTEYFTFFYYPNTGASVLGIGIETFDKNGWPTADVLG